MNKRTTWRWLGLIVALVMVMGAFPATARAQNPPPQTGGATPVPEWALIPKAPVETALDLAGTAAIQGAGINAVALNYTFSSSSGTYTEITGGTQLTTSCDDTSYNNNPIGFTFYYDGVAYTTFSVQCNGFIAMGPTVVSSYAPLSTGTTNNVISALGMDLQTNTTDSEIRYEVLGTSPNQVLVVQYKNFRNYATTGDSYNFQIRLYETSNLVEIVYGPFTKNTTARTPQVGLRGVNSSDYNNRMTDATHFWANSLPGTSNASTMALNQTTLPGNGLTYDWTIYPVRLGTSYKTASATRVVIGDPITYTVRIVNTGDVTATSTFMTDTLPVGVTYNNDVACSAGTCSWDGVNGRVLWNGDLAVGASAVVTFSVDTDNVPCGSVVNTAQIMHPDAGPVTEKSVTTQVVTALPLFEESFDGVTFPPTGWTTGIINDTGTDPAWSRVTAGANPTIGPHSGAAMAQFNSFTASRWGIAHLTTPALDLSTLTQPMLSFWMVHLSTPYSSYGEQIQVQVSTDGGTTWTDRGLPVKEIDLTYAAPGWGLHWIDLRDLAGQSSVMIRFLGYSDLGNNMFIDDVTVAEAWYPCPRVELEPNRAWNACRGTTTDYFYPLSAWNATNGADTINLTTSGGTWAASLAPTTLNLGPAAFGNTTPSVYVPWTATEGSSDTFVATAAGSGGRSDTATVRTTAAGAALYNDYADVPFARRTRDHSAVYLDGKIYKFGGWDYTNARNYVDIYDIATDTWTAGAPMPNARYWIDGGAIGNYIYLAGGYDTAARSDLQIYDVTANSWFTGTAMPAARYEYAAVVLDGRYYVIGGYDGSTYYATMWAYDPVSNSWDTTLPSMTVPRRWHSAAVIGGKIYVAGGWTTGGVGTRVVEVYDPATNTWSTVAQFPATRPDGTSITGWIRAADGVLADRYLVMLGGANTDATATVFAAIYDAVADTWSWLPYMPHLLYSAAADGDGMNDIWLVSGRVSENTYWNYGRYTTRVSLCATCEAPGGLDIAYEPAIPAPTETVYFTATTTSGQPPIAYSWNFGDGDYGAGQYVTHNYASAGIYTVWMTATNCDGLYTPSISRTVVVADAPLIVVTPDSLEAIQCPDTVTTQTLSICNAGVGMLYYTTTQVPAMSWLTTDPITGALGQGICDIVTATFDSTGLAAGAYTGTLQIASNDTQNPTVTVPLELIVAGPPTNVDFTWGPLNPWVGQDTTFTGVADSLVPVTYDWDFGDSGTASGQVVQHAFAAAGSYTVTMTATGCGAEVVEHVVTVPACTYALPMEHFEGAFPPAGWQVVNNGGTCVWQRNDAFATPRPNYAGGQGFCADADSDRCGSGSTMNTELRTYALDLSGATTATLQYIASYNYLGSDYANVDISVDGGATWTTLLHWAEDHSPNGPGEAVTLDLTPYTGYSNVLIRFHYYAPGWDWWWEVDQVQVGSCYLPDAVPDIDVTPASLYQLLIPDQTADQALNVANLDLGHLTYSFDVGCGTPVSWLSVDPPSGWLPGYSDADATVTFNSTGLAIGAYNTNICVNSNDPDEPQVQVAVTLEVTGTPEIEVTVPEPLDVTLCPDNTDIRHIVICNMGDAPLEWAISEQPGLRVTGVTASTPSLSVAAAPEIVAERIGDAVAAGVAPNGPVSLWAAPEDVLWDNGPLVTHPGGGYNGADASALQSALGMNTYGFGNQYTNGYRMADDFTISDPAGWQIDTVTFFAYQTGTYAFPPVSTITGLYVQIWDGPPWAGGTVIWGDLTTNRLASTGWSGIYRVLDTAMTNAQRPIMANTANVGITLPPGTYYLDWMTAGSLTSGPWAPPVTILGQTTTGDAYQYTTSWAPALDTGTSTQQGMPFIVEGTVPGSQDIPWLSEAPITGTLSAGGCVTVEVTYDSTGLAPDVYTGTLLIESNDSDEPVIDLPVSLEVLEPVDIVSLTSNSPVLLGTPMEFHATVNGALPIDLEWDFGGAGTPDLTDPYNPTFLYDATGSYTVILTATNDCGTDVESIAVEVIGEADIVVDPLALDAELCPDETEEQIVTICNNGNIALDWNLAELPAVRAAIPFYGPRPKVVLWDQPLSTVNQNAYVNQEFGDFTDYSSFLADDFTNSALWTIDTIFVPGNGWNGFTTLFNATALNWQVYADCAGVPCGDPSGGGSPPVWSLTLAPTDAQVTITNGTGGFPSDTTLVLATPFNLPAGHWWFIFYPTMDFATGGQFGRQPSDTVNGSIAYFINPGGGFGLGTAWQPWSVIGATQNDIAFRLEGTVFDVPWMSEDPIGGSVLPGECVSVTVTFDSTGLTPGDYFANLGIYSNDPDSPEVILPVSLTVLEPVDIVSLTSDSPVADGTPVQFHAVVNGTMPIDLVWDFGGAGTPDLTDPYNPTFLYDAPGIYTVTLEASNACGLDTASIEVEVIGYRIFLPIIMRGAQ